MLETLWHLQSKLARQTHAVGSVLQVQLEKQVILVSEKSLMRRNKKDSPSINMTGENVVGAVNASGRANVDISQSSVHKTNDPGFERLFELLEEKINARPEDPNVDKQEIQEQINQIKAEAAKGEEANPNKLERWIRNLAGMAPDIVDVMVASLGGPISGLTAVLHKIAARVKAESENKG